MSAGASTTRFHAPGWRGLAIAALPTLAFWLLRAAAIAVTSRTPWLALTAQLWVAYAAASLGLRLAPRIVGLGLSNGAALVSAATASAVIGSFAGLPLALPRLARCVERLRTKMTEAPADLGALLRRFEGARAAHEPEYLRFVQAGDGRGLRLVMLADVLFFQSDAKYTCVVTAVGESLIRTSVRDLLPRLDPAQFWQVNRGIVVNLAQVDRVDRDVLGRMHVQLKGSATALPASQSFQARFKSM